MSIGDGAERSLFLTHFARLTLSCCPSHLGPTICQGNYPSCSSPLWAAELISNHINKLDSISPDAPKFVLGDFNHCLLDKTLKTFHQYVTCQPRLTKTIDLCYGSVPAAYTSIALPAIVTADHNCVLLAPVYKLCTPRPRVQTVYSSPPCTNCVLLAPVYKLCTPRPVYEPAFHRHERVEKTVKIWTTDSIVALQDCFDCTEWHMFYDTCENLNELVDVISSYISFCVDSNQKITAFPNNKPWVTRYIKAVLNKKKRVFFQGTNEEKKTGK